MTRIFLLTVFAAALNAAETRTPVLVELFTSEGCSSCPPADVLLEKLDRQQPVAEAQIIVLSEHVDYWDHLGWRDPYSSSWASARQGDYARQFRTQGPYTPQIVVDGAAEFVGSDAPAAGAAIRSAAKQPKVPVRLTAGSGSVRVEIGPLGGKSRKASVYVAVALNERTSSVARGENQGRTLHHVAIVRSLKQVGTVSAQSGFSGDVPAERGSRIVAFIQEGSGRVLGSALVQVPE